MPVIINPLHHYYRETHLSHVIEKMKELGPPVLRAHFDGSIWHAREGTHRLRAAKALGVSPILVPVPWPRSRASLGRARIAAKLQAHEFDRAFVVLDDGNTFPLAS